MPPLSELPGDIPRKKLLRALRRVGFVVDESGGDGSHVMINWPATNKSVTMPHLVIPKQALKYLLKEIEVVTLGRVSWEEIKREL
ncbi:MAG: type II toxin-antitoxin system HicA family toxin [Patescibacteria group bacterium]